MLSKDQIQEGSQGKAIAGMSREKTIALLPYHNTQLGNEHFGM